MVTESEVNQGANVKYGFVKRENGRHVSGNIGDT
jgi:hypothetical protein